MVGLGAVAVSVVALQVVTDGTASAFDGPNGHDQFVQVSTRGAPNWGAAMQLFDWQGHLVYTWKYGLRGWKVGGKQTWWFSAGKGARVEVFVAAADGVGLSTNKLRRTFWFEPGSPDGYCFHVSPMGSVRYTGDSATGGCTPD